MKSKRSSCITRKLFFKDYECGDDRLCEQTPKRVVYETAFLLIGGGSNGGDLPKATDELVLLAAA